MRKKVPSRGHAMVRLMNQGCYANEQQFESVCREGFGGGGRGEENDVCSMEVLWQW